MLNRLRTLLGPGSSGPAPAVPAGTRVYAVGDIHGRLDLLRALIEAIEADDRARGVAQTCVIMLGDLIDRGPDSAGVIAAARDWGRQRLVRILLGNHEEMLLRALDSDEVMRHFLRYGGRETVLSYLADPEAYHRADLSAARALMQSAIPGEDLEFIRSFEDSIGIGDYLFVHAGVHPDAAIDEQQTADLRWIREPFLSHSGSFGAVVVHGHTITDKPHVRHNRIGLDTGAYRSGRLTALGLQGTARWLVEAQELDGVVTAATRSMA
jgi:serine/threonine protein phosphatase 1